MTRSEFTQILDYIGTMIGKPMAATPRESDLRSEGYWELLKDIPADVMRATARKVVLEHKWNTFPTVAELRECAVQSMRGVIADISPAEAWMMASGAAAKIDPEIRGPYIKNGKTYESQSAAILDGIPPVVEKAIRAYGLHAFCYGEEPMGVVRGQFLKLYEQIAATEKRAALIPAALAKKIEANATPLTTPAAKAIENIGKEAS